MKKTKINKKSQKEKPPVHHPQTKHHQSKDSAQDKNQKKQHLPFKLLNQH
jgi:hypothetical protein